MKIYNAHEKVIEFKEKLDSSKSFINYCTFMVQREEIIKIGGDEAIEKLNFLGEQLMNQNKDNYGSESNQNDLSYEDKMNIRLKINKIKDNILSENIKNEEELSNCKRESDEKIEKKKESLKREHQEKERQMQEYKRTINIKYKLIILIITILFIFY